MVPIISIVGKSNSGKTKLIEKLIPELKSRGYCVGTIKHDVHGFEIDIPGTDTWRHAQAGADCVVISSPQKLAVIRKSNTDTPIDIIAERYLGSIDVILTEGYKTGDKPKIEVTTSIHATDLLCSKEDGLIAIVTASGTKNELVENIAQFSIQEIDRLCDFIENKFLTDYEVPKAKLTVNGKPIRLNSFVTAVLQNTIRGLVSCLQGTENANEIKITLLK